MVSDVLVCIAAPVFSYCVFLLCVCVCVVDLRVYCYGRLYTFSLDCFLQVLHF